MPPNGTGWIFSDLFHRVSSACGTVENWNERPEDFFFSRGACGFHVPLQRPLVLCVADPYKVGDAVASFFSGYGDAREGKRGEKAQKDQYKQNLHELRPLEMFFHLLIGAICVSEVFFNLF